MATATKAKVGFGVVCPLCGDQDSTLSMDINDVRKLHCSSCDEEFSPAEAVAKARETLARWEKLARWVDAAGEMLSE